MKRITVRKHTEIKSDGTHITTSDYSEESSSSGLYEAAIAFMVFISLFLGAVFLIRVMFAPSPQPSNIQLTEPHQLSKLGAKI